MSETVGFPQAVRLYLSDPQIKDAVDILAASRGDSKTNHIKEWSDFPIAADAWLSAQVCMAEWAKFCEAIYRATIYDEAAKLENWRACSVRKQVELGLGMPSIRKAWDEGCFGQTFEVTMALGQLTQVDVSIHAGTESLYPAIRHLSFGARKAEKPPHPFVFVDEYLEPENSLDWAEGEQQDLAELRAVSRDLVAAANELLLRD